MKKTPLSIQVKIDEINAASFGAIETPYIADDVSRCVNALVKMGQDGRTGDEAISALAVMGFTADEIKAAIEQVKAQ